MRHFKPERSHYIPAGAIERKDNESSAVAYTYESGGKPVALCFSGKRQKPDSHYRYASEERRAAAIEEHARGVRATEAYRAKRDADNKAARSKTSALDFTGKDYLSAAECAALCRRSLAESFPGQRFSVRADRSLRVTWTDGPSREAVDRIASQCGGSYFDGMIDYRGSLYHELDGRRVRFGADFVFCERTMSTDGLRAGLAAFEAAHPDAAGALAIEPPQFDGWSASVKVLNPDAGALMARGCDTDAPDPEGNFVRVALAVERWHDAAHPVAAQPSATFARFHILGSDGYGQSGYEPANGGEGMNGYPRDKPREPEPEAPAAELPPPPVESAPPRPSALVESLIARRFAAALEAGATVH